MSFATQTVLKPISMATNGCLISGPSHLTTSRISCSNPYASIPYKPIKFPCLFSLNRKEPLYRVSVIASQQEENNPVILEEKAEEQKFQGNFNWDSSENDEHGDGYVEPSEEAKVYVGNLPYDVDGEKLAHLFEQAGVVEIAEVIYNRVTDQSRGFGFVPMSTEEEAERAVEMLHRYDVKGRLLTVYKAAPRELRPERAPRAPRTFEPSYRIYAGSLPWSVDDSRLEQIFSKHGNVVSARVVSDMETGRSRGFGFVVMSSESEMNDAIKNLDGQSLDGRAIRVNAAEDKPRRSSL